MGQGVLQEHHEFLQSVLSASFHGQEDHPYYEVETTIVPGKECYVEEEEDEPEEKEIRSKAEDTDRSHTKICTKYIPHRPSKYRV